MPECPYCGEALAYDDYYGRILPHQDGTVIGDIYQCRNVSCDVFQSFFHIIRDEGDEIHEGYPC